MIRHSRRMVAVAVAVVGALTIASAVSACGAGNDPQTAKPTQLTEGVNVTTKNGVAVRNLFVLGPPPAGQLAAGSAATVYAWIVNDSSDGQPDRLVGIAAPGVARGQIQGGGIALPYQQLVRLGVPTPAGITTPLLTLQDLATPLSGGESIRLTLQFQRAGALEALVPVVTRDSYYSTYAPAPVVTPSAAPTGTATGTASPTGTATPADTATPTRKATHGTATATATPSPTR